MRIQHNIMAMSAYRNYTNNVSAMKKNLEKLSSGYKINRAGDDAAGLAISEKMRAQITGLETAQKNAKDGISLVQTAEGALTEVHDMLNRMVELATQSANGTYDNTTDRAQLQKELEQLNSEINRIADSSNFNGIQLLDGSMAITEAVEASTTTTTNSVSGMDRIIKTTLGAGDTASVEAGKKTIFDQVATASKAVKASFVVDLGTLNFGNNLTKTDGTTTKDFTLTINGTDITVTATGLKSSTSVNASAGTSSIAGKIAKALVNAAKASNTTYTTANTAWKASGTKGGVIINGVKWKVAVESGTKLVFSQLDNPKTADDARANFDVNIKVSDGDGIVLKAPANEDKPAGDIVMSASLDAGTYVRTPGVAMDNLNKANTVFEIRESDLTDGTQIAIGTKTAILKVGTDSTVTATTAASKGIYVVTLNANDNLNTALGKISEALGSTVKFVTATGAKVEFKLGVSDGKNGNTIGLAVQRVKQALAKGTGTVAAKTAFDSLEKLANNFAMKVKETTKTEAKEAQTGLTLQIGDTAEKFNQLNVSIGDMHAAALGLDKISIADQESAAAAVDAIKAAINQVSDVRGTLGATQNRLDHTINNLSVMTENIQDAESTIRDTDVAAEMMAYTKNNILIQSAQAMLAQANQVPQGVLQLLQ